MNIKDIETLLYDFLESHDTPLSITNLTTDQIYKTKQAIIWINKREVALMEKRVIEFKLRAAEPREALR